MTRDALKTWSRMTNAARDGRGVRLDADEVALLVTAGELAEIGDQLLALQGDNHKGTAK